MLRIATTDQRMIVSDKVSWVHVHWKEPSEGEFRDSIRLLSTADYFVVDKRNRWVGLYVGFCLASNIEFILIGIPSDSYYGAYAHFSRREWRQFADKLPSEREYTELALADEIESTVNEIQSELRDHGTVGGIPATAVPFDHSG